MNSLKKHRILSCMTRKQAEKATGIPYSTLTGWETGIRRPRPDSLAILAKAYNCKVEDFLDLYEE